MGDVIGPFKLRVIRREFVKLGLKVGDSNIWKKFACTPKSVDMVCTHTQKRVHKVGMWFKSVRLPRGLIKDMSLGWYVWVSRTYLLLQNSISLKPFWKTLNIMQKLCILYANTLQKVCKCRLNAYYFVLNTKSLHTVSAKSVQLQTKRTLFKTTFLSVHEVCIEIMQKKVHLQTECTLF